MLLTDKQRQHLQALAGGERGAYPGLHMGTLTALERKKLVAAQRGLGSMAMPRTATLWKLTEAGKSLLAKTQ
jgi:hypothetical protein